VKKLIFIDLNSSSFIKNDELILSKYFELKIFRFKIIKGWYLIIELLRQLIFLLGHIRKADAIYVWFGDFNSVLPSIIAKLFSKKIFIVIGGYDAAYRPDINYGIKTRLIGKISSKISTRLATNLLAVSNFTKNELINNINPKLEDKISVIHNCFNIPRSNTKAILSEKENVLMVSIADGVNRIFIKGIDFYVEVAKSMPEKSFELVGISGEALDYINKIKSDNLSVVPKVPHSQLKLHFEKARVVCQFSRYESFGLAIIEGIFNNCYPVGYNFAAPAELLKDNAILIDELDVDMAKYAINKAFTKTQEDLDLIKNNMNDLYSFEVRKNNLIHFLESKLN